MSGDAKFSISKYGLARLLTAMTYRELSEMGRELHAMTKDDPIIWDLSKPHEWSALLSAWAENVVEVEGEEEK